MSETTNQQEAECKSYMLGWLEAPHVPSHLGELSNGELAARMLGVRDRLFRFQEEPLTAVELQSALANWKENQHVTDGYWSIGKETSGKWCIKRQTAKGETTTITGVSRDHLLALRDAITALLYAKP